MPWMSVGDFSGICRLETADDRFQIGKSVVSSLVVSDLDRNVEQIKLRLLQQQDGCLTFSQEAVIWWSDEPTRCPLPMASETVLNLHGPGLHASGGSMSHVLQLVVTPEGGEPEAFTSVPITLLASTRGRSRLHWGLLAAPLLLATIPPIVRHFAELMNETIVQEAAAELRRFEQRPWTASDLGARSIDEDNLLFHIPSFLDAPTVQQLDRLIDAGPRKIIGQQGLVSAAAAAPPTGSDAPA
jgi:hypothetical protein